MPRGNVSPCCCDNCLIFRDFCPPVSASQLDMEGNWDEAGADGEWTFVLSDLHINCFAVHEVGTAGAQFIAAHPNDNEYGVVSVQSEVCNMATGDKWRVLVNWLDEDNYHYAEFEKTSTAFPGGAIIRIGKRTSGSDATLEEQEVDGYSNSCGVLRICFWEGGVQAGYSGATFSYVWDDIAPTPIVGGFRAGFENTSGITDMQFTAFRYDRARSPEYPDCGYCICTCADQPPSKTLNLEIIGFGTCDEISRSTITLTWGRNIQTTLDGGGVHGPGWVSAVVDYGCARHEYLLFCGGDEDDPTSWRLRVLGDCCDSDPNDCTNLANEGASCISLEFGPFLVGNTDLGCFCCGNFDGGGGWMALVTE